VRPRIPVFVLVHSRALGLSLSLSKHCHLVPESTLRASWISVLQSGLPVLAQSIYFPSVIASSTTSMVTLVQIGGGVEKPSGALAASARLDASVSGTIFKSLSINIVRLIKA